jgi:hypothetical protein
MKFHPLNQKSQGSLREGPFDQAGLDLDQHFMLLVPGMEVGWIMVPEMHVYDDSIETAYDGQVVLPLWDLNFR